jgi:hypothetical protein
MKRYTTLTIILTSALLLVSTFVAADTKPDVSKIYGKIKFVDHFPDYKVKVVDHFADLHVKLVDHFPNKPGRWKIVDHFEGFKLKKVEHFEDFTIKFVEHFEGVQ